MKLSKIKVRQRGQSTWLAGFWEDGNESPSAADGSIGFYGATPEEAVQKLMKHIEKKFPAMKRG